MLTSQAANGDNDIALRLDVQDALGMTASKLYHSPPSLSRHRQYDSLPPLAVSMRAYDTPTPVGKKPARAQEKRLYDGLRIYAARLSSTGMKSKRLINAVLNSVAECGGRIGINQPL